MFSNFIQAVGWTGAYGAFPSGAYPKLCGKVGTAAVTSVSLVWGSLLRWQRSDVYVLFDNIDEVVQQQWRFIDNTVGGSGDGHTTSQQHRVHSSWGVGISVCSYSGLTLHGGGSVDTQLAYGLWQRLEIGYCGGCWHSRVLVFGGVRRGQSVEGTEHGREFLEDASLSLGVTTKAGHILGYMWNACGAIDPLGGPIALGGRWLGPGANSRARSSPGPPHLPLPSSCPSPLGCGGLEAETLQVCWDAAVGVGGGEPGEGVVMGGARHLVIFLWSRGTVLS